MFTCRRLSRCFFSLRSKRIDSKTRDHAELALHVAQHDTEACISLYLGRSRSRQHVQVQGEHAHAFRSGNRLSFTQFFVLDFQSRSGVFMKRRAQILLRNLRRVPRNTALAAYTTQAVVFVLWP